MAYRSKLVTVNDSEPVKVLDGDEGAAAVLRNPDDSGVIVALGGPEDEEGPVFTLAPGGVITAPIGGRDDDLYAIVTAAAEGEGGSGSGSGSGSGEPLECELEVLVNS